MSKSTRYITTWRKRGEQFLDWDHYVSEDRREVEEVVKNLKSQGVRQFNTFELGALVDDLSTVRLPLARAQQQGERG